MFDFVSSHRNHFEWNLFCANFAQTVDDWDELDGMLNVDKQLAVVVCSAVAVDTRIRLCCLAPHKLATIDRPLFAESCNKNFDFINSRNFFRLEFLD